MGQSDHFGSDQVGSDRVWLGQIRSGQVRSGQVRSGRVAGRIVELMVLVFAHLDKQGGGVTGQHAEELQQDFFSMLSRYPP